MPRLFFILLSFLMILITRINIVEGVDECSAGLHTCHPDSVCNDTDVNVNGTAICTCKTGFTGNQTHCEDIDECAKGTHGCHENATCHNLVASHNCTCKPGYSGDGISCSDVDECLENRGNCHANASCINLPGSYTCSCAVRVDAGKSCQVSSYCPTAGNINDDNDDDRTLIILASVVIALLVWCLISLLIAICCFYRLESMS